MAIRCDFESDGGGWTKILHLADDAVESWVAGSTGIVGNVATGDVVGFAKHSDDRINAMTLSKRHVYRFESGCSDKKFFLETSGTYDDDRNGLGLVSDEQGDPLGGLRVCLNSNFEDCTWQDEAPVFVREIDVNGLL